MTQMNSQQNSNQDIDGPPAANTRSRSGQQLQPGLYPSRFASGPPPGPSPPFLQNQTSNDFLDQTNDVENQTHHSSHLISSSHSLSNRSMVQQQLNPSLHSDTNQNSNQYQVPPNATNNPTFIHRLFIAITPAPHIANNNNAPVSDPTGISQPANQYDIGSAPPLHPAQFQPFQHQLSQQESPYHEHSSPPYFSENLAICRLAQLL